MDPHQPLGLDGLRALNRDDLQDEIKKIVPAKEIKLRGLVLFKYYKIPHIIEERKTIEQEMSAQMAEIIAGMRWYKIDIEEEDCWARLATELLVKSTEGDKGVIEKPATAAEDGDDLDCGPLINHPLPVCQEVDEAPRSPRSPQSTSDTRSSCSSSSGHTSLTSTPEVDSMSLEVDKLKEVEPSATKNDRLIRLADSISSDGRTLFLRHATAIAAQDGKQAPSEYARSLWQRLAVHERSSWIKATSRIRSGLKKDVDGTLDHLVIDSYSESNQRYANQIRATFFQFGDDIGDGGGHRVLSPSPSRVSNRNPPQSTSSSKACAGDIEPLPTLRLLCGGSAASLSLESVIPSVLSSITYRWTYNKEMRLRGRYYGVRINYDPEASDSSSILARLKVAKNRPIRANMAAGSDFNALREMESVLKPLMHWNVDNWGFPEIRNGQLANTESVLSRSDVYDSSFCFMVEKLEQLRPIVYTRKEHVVSEILYELRKREREMSSAASPEHWNSAELRTSLAIGGEITGLLKSCFMMDDLMSDEYEDLLDQQLYEVQHRFPFLKLIEK